MNRRSIRNFWRSTWPRCPGGWWMVTPPVSWCVPCHAPVLLLFLYARAADQLFMDTIYWSTDYSRIFFTRRQEV